MSLNMFSQPSSSNKAGKRLFSTIVEVATTNKLITDSSTQIAEVIESKRPRVVNNNRPPTTTLSTSTSTTPAELMLVDLPSCTSNLQRTRSAASTIKQPVFIDAHVQTDFNLHNSVISPIPETSVFIVPNKLPPALISPPKTPPSFRSNPQLSRAKSTVSISSVQNVAVSKKLISFSSMCSMDLTPSTSAVQTEIKQPSVAELRPKRPRLKHTRTAAVDGTDNPSEFGQSLQPNKKLRVDFGSVDVYSFNFTQSYDTVPSEGVSLGMEDKHHEVRHYESYRDFQRERFVENTANKHSLDSMTMAGNKRRRVRSTQDSLMEDLRASRRAIADTTCVPSGSNAFKRNSDKSDEEFEHNKRNKIMLPMDKKRKQAIIKSNEIQIDKEINEECVRIKLSRELCGCSCEKGVCLPESCQCSLDGIGCLVDKPAFPCSCSKGTCKNPNERHEFDFDKVQMHYRQTLKRFKSASRRQPEEEGLLSRTKSLSSLPLPNSRRPQPVNIPLTSSFEKLELKTPSSSKPARKLLDKSPSLSKITTQFSSSGSISIPFRTPPHVTRRQVRPRRYPVTPTFRQGKSAGDEPSIVIDEPSVITLNDSTLTQSVMEIDDSIQILSPAIRSSTRKFKARPNSVCEVVITKPTTDLFSIDQQNSEDLQTIVDGIIPQKSLLSAESRSLSATTTEETSRTNSTEEFQTTPAVIRID
ncbi:Cysteine/serine-rich nuclear protein 3-like protein [Aphelenchoides bicaudatus]|nr:Cysteine/serine-rich nuclear protein 3-like protein [Aphelenchoides bicaudatus]